MLKSLANNVIGLVKRSPLRPIAARARYSRAGNTVFALPGRMRLELARLSGEPVLFEIDGKMGMGAMLSHMTLLLALGDRLGVRPLFRFSNPLYARDGVSDWFGDFFELVDPPQRVRESLRIRIRNDVDHEILGTPLDLSLAEGHAIFATRVRFKPFLVSEADAFFAEHLAGKDPLGVHYRGTDKHSEAPQVERARAIAVIGRQVRRGKHRAIFLATDEPAFAAEMRDAFPQLTIVSYERPELAPAKPGEPIHFSSGDGYWKGVDALVNILLLARCGAVVRTASFLSGWAKVLSPKQQILMLNNAFSTTRFPDNQIVSDITDSEA